MRAWAAAVLLGACATPPTPPPEIVPSSPSEALSDSPAHALGDFLTAAEQGRFDEVHARLSAALRQRYSPERLKSDFEAEPLAKERLARARRAWSARAPWRVDGAVAFLPLDDGHRVRAVQEDGGWRIAALEE
ncbi:MAG: hypothetical protein AB1938_00550 [Myxococcota bacterium]